MSEIIGGLNQKIKSSSSSLTLFTIKASSGLIIGLTFAIVGQEMIGYGSFAFFFVLFSMAGAFLKISKKWRFFGVFIFNLICVLVALLLRMYVIIAPGA